MDYLSGKQSIQPTSIVDEKKEKIVESSVIFNEFCERVFACLNPDERANISESFLTNEIISVRVDRTRKQPLTTLLRALGIGSNAEILEIFIKYFLQFICGYSANLIYFIISPYFSLNNMFFL